MRNCTTLCVAVAFVLACCCALAGERLDDAVASSAASNAEDLYKLGMEEDLLVDSTASQPVFTDVPLRLGPAEVIKLTVQYSPSIRLAYERKLAEEGRYRFFMVSREAFSYGTGLNFDYEREHDDDWTNVEKNVVPSVYMTKEFYDTTSTFARLGYDVDASHSDGDGNNAFVSGGVRLPLFASREALQRSNEKIYQQNKVNDARLEYVREIRDQILDALESLSNAQRDQEMLRYEAEYIADLKGMLNVAASIEGRDTSFDRTRIEAALASVSAFHATNVQAFEVSKERLKMQMGIPFDTPIEVKEDSFNPFEGETREELEKIALATDEEIKTLLNSVRSSQAELDLARKGKWDTSLFLEGRREFLGMGNDEGDVTYGVTTGVAVTRIDSRISRSLEEVALASLRGYRNAILSRRREIHTNTLGSFSALNARLAEVAAIEENLPRYRSDYVKGIEQYQAGAISVDDLIKKRQELFNQLDGVLWARHNAIGGMASLLSATGRYERYLDAETAPKATGGARDSGEGPPETLDVESTDGGAAPAVR